MILFQPECILIFFSRQRHNVISCYIQMLIVQRIKPTCTCTCTCKSKFANINNDAPLPNSPQILQNPSPDFDGFSTPQYRPANRACSHVYQIHLTPPAAFVGFRTVYIVKPWMLCILLLYQIHQTPPAAFVGFRTVYSQAMDSLQFATVTNPSNYTGCFCWIPDCVYSQAMDALHFATVPNPSDSTGCFCWIQDCV